MNTSLLVVTHYVYAKSRDGALYPGRIIGKESENSYNIEFSDLTCSTVNENDLVWLGFYRLPPDCWPKSPVILPVKSTRDDTETYSGKAKEQKVDGFPSREPESLRIIKNSPKEWIHENSQCMNERMANFVPSVPHKEGQRQIRSSVLRLNREALSKEISQNHIEDSMSSPRRLGNGTVDDRWWRYERKEHHFSNSSLCSMSPHPSYDHHDPAYSNTPCLTPPSTPGSLPPPLYICKPYNTADFGEMWSHMDTRDIGGGKKRRDNMKKCRKVYGIDNRDLWCTQCKWKKACSRFQIRNYRERYF